MALLGSNYAVGGGGGGGGPGVMGVMGHAPSNGWRRFRYLYQMGYVPRLYHTFGLGWRYET
jgi:hypothetical protein